MTVFDRGQLERFGRKSVPGVAPRIEQDILPNAPGLETPPPVSSGSTILQQFTATMASAGMLADEVAQTVRQAEYLDEKSIRDAQAESEAQARRDRAVLIPRIRSEILSGKIVKTDPDQTDEDFAIQVAAAQVPEGMADAYRQEFVDGFAPVVAGAIADRNARAIEIARQEQTMAIVNGAVGVTDPSKLAEISSQLQSANPNVGPEKAREAVGLRALQWAGSANDPAEGRKALNAAKEFLGPGYGPETETVAADIARAEAGIANKEATKKEEDQDQAINDLARMEMDGATTTAMRAFVENDPRFSEVARNGQLKRIDGIDEGKINEAQYLNSNTLARRIGLGDWIGGSKEATLQEVVRRSGLGVDDPEFLSWPAADRLLDGMLVQEKADADRMIVDQMMWDIAETGRTKSPATDNMDESILRSLSARGVVNGIDTGESFTFSGVLNPTALAEFAKASNHVPRPVREQIIAGASSQDPAHIAEALTVWSAVHFRDPELASRVPLYGDGAVRARFVAARLNADLPWSKRADDAAIRDAIQRMGPQLLRLDPKYAEMPAEKKQLILWGKGNDEKVSADTAYSEALKSIEAATFSDYTGVGQGSWPFGRKNPKIPHSMVYRYQELAAEEFEYQRSFIPTDQEAAKAAKAFATARLFGEYPTTEWGDQVRYMNSGEIAPNAAMLRTDLNKSVGDDNAENLWNNAMPTWVGNGWAFASLDPPYNYYVDDDGGVLVLNPNGADVREDVRTRMNKILEERAKGSQRNNALFRRSSTIFGQPD